MILSQKALKLIESFESCAQYDQAKSLYFPYHGEDDVPGVMSVGWGHKIRSGEDFSAGLTQQQCDDLQLADSQFAEKVINTLVKVPLNQNQFDALVSFVYNLGGGTFAASKHLLPALNAGNYTGAANYMGDYFYSGRPPKPSSGLQRRRQAEIALFTTPVSVLESV